jgi:hypothetical protein
MISDQPLSSSPLSSLPAVTSDTIPTITGAGTAAVTLNGAGSGNTGIVGAGTGTFNASATGSAAAIGSGAITADFTASGVGVLALVGAGTVTASFGAGAVASVALAGYGSASITFSADSVGVLTLVGSGAASVQYTTGYAAVSMSATDTVAFAVNCRTLMGSEYEHFPFTSLARQGREYYGAIADGIYRLTGPTDAGTPINANLIGAISDFGNRNEKYFPYAHVFLRGEGALSLTLVTDETKPRDYPVTAREGQQGLHTKRCKLARGIKGRSAQLKISNVDGCDFDLQEIQLTYDATGRS